MKHLHLAAECRSTPVLERKFSLPFGYEAAFYWHPDGLETRWCPDVPFIRKPRARRKFFAAYQLARRSFVEELAAVIGGRILILDITSRQNTIVVVDAEYVHQPTRH